MSTLKSLTANELFAIGNEIYDDINEDFQKVGVKLGLKMREELIKKGIPENEVFYSTEWTLLTGFFDSSLMTAILVGANYSGLTGQEDVEIEQDE